jgi:hypothetical protein
MILRFLGRVVDVAGELARTAVAIGEVVGEAAVRRVRERRDDTSSERVPASAPSPQPPAPARPMRTERPAPVAPAAEPEPLAVVPDPELEPLASVPEPTRGQAARLREREREAERTDDSPGAQVRVDEPWPGYAAMNAPEIIDRVRAADDEAVRAIVALYERSHRKRKTVLRAAGVD